MFGIVCTGLMDPPTYVHRVEGEHLYDSLEDGTEVVAPLDCPTLSSLYTDDEQDDTISDDE